MLQMLVHRARAGADDFADVLVGLAFAHPEQDFRFAQGQAVGGDQVFDGGLVVFFVQHQQPFLLVRLAFVPKLARVVQAGQQATIVLAGEQRRLAVFAGGLLRFGQPFDQARRGQPFRHAEIFMQQPSRQRRLPEHAAILVAQRDGGLAEGIQRAARLLHLARVLHVRGNAGQHFLRPDRLGDVIRAAGGEGGDDVFGLGQAGHEHDRNVLCAEVGLQPTGDFEAVHAGHQCVEQDHVGPALARALQRRFAVGGDQHGVAGFIQRVVQQREVFRDVVDDQDDIAVERVKRHGGLRRELCE